MYKLDKNGIYVSEVGVEHRNEEYSESSFDILVRMQSDHFWYKGRHKFLLRSLRDRFNRDNLSIADFGGGCGGWIQYLLKKHLKSISEIALADSSQVALLNAKRIIGSKVDIYQVDLMNIEWENKWDVIFMLDVIEHCPEDTHILMEAKKALKPGGVIILTAPALDFFWSYNDEHANHLRRYDIMKFHKLSINSGLNLVDARYFMFFLSPLLWLSRRLKSKKMSEQKILQAVESEHEIPPKYLNKILSYIFEAETPLGHVIRFPWGTSILGVFEKPKL